MTNAKKPMGRAPIASDEQLERISQALASVPKNSQEYRTQRRTFAVALNCTERAIELMVERFQKRMAAPGDSIPAPDCAETALESLPTAS